MASSPHIDAGKTTTSERIFVLHGRVAQNRRSARRGGNHGLDGTRTGAWYYDYLCRNDLFWTPTYAPGDAGAKCRFNIIDTPGHVDFTVEVERSLKVLDGGVVVFDGVAGVEPQSETVWRQADKYSVPRICFINKLDRTGASFDRSFKSFWSGSQRARFVFQIPIGEEDAHEGVIDLLRMKALYFFEGDMGNKVIEKKFRKATE